MPVDTCHSEYEKFLQKWIRAREVLAGEDTIKQAGVKYLPRLESQTDVEYANYVARAVFYNATGRTAEGFSGMIFRREPVIKLPGSESTTTGTDRSRSPSGVLPARGTDQQGSRHSKKVNGELSSVFERFQGDVDCLGTSLYLYIKRLTTEVLGVGRAGTLIEWNDEEQRAFVCQYLAEQIINWKMQRIGGRNELALVVLKEMRAASADAQGGISHEDPFEDDEEEQIRVLRLVKAEVESPNAELNPAEGPNLGRGGTQPYRYVVEIWRKGVSRTGQGPSRTGHGDKVQWILAETKVPMRRGQPLTSIPFVFHGPYDSLPKVSKLPLDDIIAVNLDHYRLDADYKHGLHFTALPTAWVSGFAPDAQLRIGSSMAWVTETVGAQAGFLEFTGQGLGTFERAMDHAERLMAILGSRLLESQKRVSESAEALTLRQAGEGSIVANISSSLSKSMTQILRWVYWWSSIETDLGQIGEDKVSVELNRDFETATMTPQEVTALVAAWQAGAISRESLLNLMRRGELLEPARSNEEEIFAIKKESTVLTTKSTEGGKVV
jgi:hypothetical protein